MRCGALVNVELDVLLDDKLVLVHLNRLLDAEEARRAAFEVGGAREVAEDAIAPAQVQAHHNVASQRGSFAQTNHGGVGTPRDEAG